MLVIKGCSIWCFFFIVLCLLGEVGGLILDWVVVGIL